MRDNILIIFKFLIITLKAIIVFTFKVIALTGICALCLFGLVYLLSPPPRRKILWEKFQAFGHKMGVFNSRVILTLFYWLIMTPYAIVMMPFIDPLRIKTKQTWLSRTTKDLTIKDAQRQF